MFGSKHLLLFTCLGASGVVLAAGMLSDTLGPAKLAVFSVGLALVWVSSMYGPIFYMQDKGILNDSDKSQHKDGKPGSSGSA